VHEAGIRYMSGEWSIWGECIAGGVEYPEGVQCWEGETLKSCEKENIQGCPYIGCMEVKVDQ